MRGKFVVAVVCGLVSFAGCSAEPGEAADSQDGSSSGTSPGSTSSTSSPGSTGATSSGTTGTTNAETSSATTQGTSGDEASTGAVVPGNCFQQGFVNPPDLGPDYTPYAPVIGTHCYGTDHQDIEGIERVVFLGDSVTVGTPPSLPDQGYRSRLAVALQEQFDVSLGSNSLLWFSANPFDGLAIAENSGDFSVCAKWGARNDDLMPEGGQLETCFPPEVTNLRTLTIMTSGGNDLSSLTKAAIDGATMEELQNQAEEIVDNLRQSIAWLTDAERFPNGNFVIYGNMYEFTDGTGDVESCDVSGLAGFDMPVPAPDDLTEIVIWIEEQYLQIAVEYGVDMTFMLEQFCGHGFNNENPAAPCYRGPGTERWFDLTCIHPNPTGHQQLADMFMAVVLE